MAIGRIPTLIYVNGAIHGELTNCKTAKNSEVDSKKYSFVDSQCYLYDQLETLGNKNWCWVKVNLVTPGDPGNPNQGLHKLLKSEYLAWIEAKQLPSSDEAEDSNQTQTNLPKYKLTVKHGYTEFCSKETAETKALATHWQKGLKAYPEKPYKPFPTDTGVRGINGDWDKPQDISQRADGSWQTEITCDKTGLQQMKLADQDYSENSNFGFTQAQVDEYNGSGIELNTEVEIHNNKHSRNFFFSGEEGATYTAIFRKTDEKTTVEIKKKE
ncbi:hypothetical protein SOPP22_11325 [Shewanella sp. OPT22]|nr:hypothetical protein SOPP22_11325 [Shewanella sp. OPT22]